MIKPDLQRRNLLRGALAAGGALFLPAIAGCKETPPPAPDTAGTTTPASPPAAAEAPPPAAAGSGKISQAQAQYQDMPKGDQRCANCLHFIAESNTCKVVEGQVKPEGWCMLWAKKA
jgi:hypothetical protein